MEKIAQNHFKSELKETTLGYAYILECPDGLTYGSLSYNRYSGTVWGIAYSNGGDIMNKRCESQTWQTFVVKIGEFTSFLLEHNIICVDDDGFAVQLGL